ncbi:hypothetical protein [Arthrobacter sp. NEB 688]|uniref:hypothetical protein n=1 Tax=Arthrobacter sp. NEB 688 TaxID=904039 RepID=UPI0015668A86|nr:hypothetical protein [Arthrobacter sp. NEB 688]QKE82807.1 hypothetical protein HL663_01815 [Arthrobacter sp. NEB 688]
MSAVVRSSTRRPGDHRLPPRAVSVAGVAVGLGLLFLVQVRPGWRALTVLTPAAAEVVPFVVAALWTGVLAEAVALVVRTTWWRTVAGLVTSAVGLAAAVAAWDVFPVVAGSPWRTSLRAVLVVAVVSGVVGVVSSLLGPLGGRPTDTGGGRRR